MIQNYHNLLLDLSKKATICSDHVCLVLWENVEKTAFKLFRRHLQLDVYAYACVSFFQKNQSVN